MAQTLTISDGTTTVNLLTGYAKLTVEGWSEQSVSGKIWSTFTLAGSDTATDANIRTFKKQIDNLIEDARRFRDEPFRSKVVWLTWQSEGESAKHAVVTDGESEILSSEFDSPLLGSAFFGMTLTLEHDVWVNTSAVSQTNTASMTTLGYRWIPNPGYEGTEDGHISYIKLESAESVVTIDDIWIGIRPTNEGAADFRPLIECEIGTGNGSDTITATDATASGNSKFICDFSGTETMAYRFEVSLDDLLTNENPTHWNGRYLVLMRCKTGASTAVAIQMRWGQAYDENLIPSGSVASTVYINNQTSWKLIELGYINLPTHPNKYYDATGITFLYERVKIYAERLSGAGDLHMDCLVLIPAEHLFSCRGGLVGAASIGGPMYVITGPDGSQYAKGTTSQGVFFDAQAAFNDWVYPAEGGVVVIAGQGFSGHVKGSAFSKINLQVYPRWKSYRA